MALKEYKIGQRFTMTSYLMGVLVAVDITFITGMNNITYTLENGDSVYRNGFKKVGLSEDLKKHHYEIYDKTRFSKHQAKLALNRFGGL